VANKERVLEYLRSHPLGADDDAIGAELDIDRHAVNALCRALVSEGKAKRFTPIGGGKIVTRAVTGGERGLADAVVSLVSWVYHNEKVREIAKDQTEKIIGIVAEQTEKLIGKLKENQEEAPREDDGHAEPIKLPVDTSLAKQDVSSVAAIGSTEPPFGTSNGDAIGAVSHTWRGYSFTLVCTLEPKRGAKGEILEFMPHSRYLGALTKKLNLHGAGPFCEYRIPDSYIMSGVYLITRGNMRLYVGRAVNLTQRFNTGYGTIQPVNAFEGGQSTNCKINRHVLDETKRGEVLHLWFFATPDYKRVEAELLLPLLPWNGRR
jgi:hypothetical protein